MQCKSVTTLPSVEKWTFEIKFDGYRCIALRAGGVNFGACDAQGVRVFYATLTIPITSLRTSYGSRVLPAAVQASIKPKDGRATPEVRFENDGCFFTKTGPFFIKFCAFHKLQSEIDAYIIHKAA